MDAILKELSATEKKLIANALEIWLAEMKKANATLLDRVQSISNYKAVQMFTESANELECQYEDFNEVIKQLRT